MKKFKVIISEEVKFSIDRYMNFYKSYYEELFYDSWIWSKNIILENYNFDAKVKTEEIIDLIIKRLSDNLIFYSENIAKIKWRTKILKVKFLENWEYRLVTELKII